MPLIALPIDYPTINFVSNVILVFMQPDIKDNRYLQCLDTGNTVIVVFIGS